MLCAFLKDLNKVWNSYFVPVLPIIRTSHCCFLFNMCRLPIPVQNQIKSSCYNHRLLQHAWLSKMPTTWGTILKRKTDLQNIAVERYSNNSSVHTFKTKNLLTTSACTNTHQKFSKVQRQWLGPSLNQKQAREVAASASWTQVWPCWFNNCQYVIQVRKHDKYNSRNVKKVKKKKKMPE